MSLTHLIPWSNKRPEQNPVGLPQIRDEIDRFFGRFLQEAWDENWPVTATTAWMPALEMSETDTEIVVQAEIPGVDPGNFDISLDRGTLTISGQKQETSEKKESNYHCTECHYGSFTRSLHLPAEVDRDKIEAVYKNGVLTVMLAKTPTAIAKRIAVKNG